jgi:glycosyltransferase involved in cell wall biosynthesis
MKRRLRVLHVVHELDYGGLERLVGAIVRFIDRDRFDSHVMTLSRFGRFAEGLGDFAELHRVASIPHFSMLWPASVIRKIRSIAPDVVHTHSGAWYKGSLAARRAGVPRLVHTDHGRHYPDPLKIRFFEGLAARRTDVIVAVSEALARDMADAIGIDSTRIQVVVNGVDAGCFRPRRVNGAFRRELGVPPGTPVIGSIGRLDPIKAYDIMIRAFGVLRANWTEGPAPALVLVGDGPDRARLAALIEQDGLRDAVWLPGWRKDVESLYPAFDVFSLSSWSEGTSLGLLEAMSSGVCPVVTAVGGSPAVLGERLRHRLVRPGDPTALAQAWRDALAHRDEREADGAVARARVEQAFGLDMMVRQYERIYAGDA